MYQMVRDCCGSARARAAEYFLLLNKVPGGGDRRGCRFGGTAPHVST